MAVGLCVVSGQQSSETEQLKQQLQQLQENLERTQREYQAQIQELQKRVHDLEQTSAGAPARLSHGQPVVTDLDKESNPGSNWVAATASSSRGSASILRPLESKDGRSYLDIGLIGTFAAGTSTADDISGGTQLGGHDPNQRGFTVQGIEANFAGAVDPYFRANANVLFQVDEDGESRLELEEAWLETLSLSSGLQVRAGEFYTEFGRQNSLHPHAWAFVDQPVVLGRFLGPDGLRNPGARASWLTPTPFFSELLLSVQNSQGETASSFRSGGGHGNADESALPLAYRHADNDRGVDGLEDLLLSPRYALSLDLTDNQVLLLGASAAFGPNSRGSEDAGSTLTQIYGFDLTWKWKSPEHHAGFPFVSFQTEGLMRRYEAGHFDWDENGNGLVDFGEVVDSTTGLPAFLARETLTDYGFYSQLLYGFRKGWVAGLRFEYSAGETADYEQSSLTLDGEPLGRDPLRSQRWRVSPNLTWYPSEFSKIRLQYNYDDRLVVGVDHSVWLQFEFLLGAHAAHRF